MTYSDYECNEDQADEYDGEINTNLMWTKVMTQSFNDPSYYRETGDILDTYFTNRYKTQLNSGLSLA